ncbi:hypothetical protein ETAA8_43280 [Anatilimnocola aggregata]|uniref:Uncharacterized protein n=1 Tax=Anatilimnocola aggregata TaxID=2528021 RepID=A0A517YG93_9BACT|nr:hypothetical protein [Anatilimnocola aggregata]QDU29221.1 hypothetical protein ETAA8_43280 [Anatilimnocola aggregata]
MAKKAKSGPNKSLAIRNYKVTNPSASPKEIAEALSKTGMEVTPQFVSTVLSNAKRKGGVIGKRGRKPGKVPATASGGSSIEQLVKAKKLVDQLGGIDAAKSAISALAQILG